MQVIKYIVNNYVNNYERKVYSRIKFFYLSTDKKYKQAMYLAVNSAAGLNIYFIYLCLLLMYYLAINILSGLYIAHIFDVNNPSYCEWLNKRIIHHH